jgi:DUF1009 family protein
VGLLAAAGRFPVAFAEKARAVGRPVVCVGLSGVSPELSALCARFHRSSPVRVGRMIRLFRQAGVREVVMAGKVQKANLLYRPWRLLTLLPDWRTLKVWYFGRRADNRDDTLLLALIAEFARDGLQFVSALDLCPELLVNPGVLTRRAPTQRENTDVVFGWDLAKEMGRLDVGQSVAVKEQSALAVEAVEGTDAAIVRAGHLCRAGGFVVVKVAKPQQDMRFDVPTVGTLTIQTLRQAGGRVLAIEAGRTIVLDQAETVALADRHGISVVAVDAAWVERHRQARQAG